MEMTSYERFSRMYQHKEADRIPIIDVPWEGTLLRWQKEGMPKNCDWRDFFGIDKVAKINVDISPRYPVKIIEETETSITKTTEWGVTLRYNKEVDSTPDFLDFHVTDKDKWNECKKRMLEGANRINWKYLEDNYAKWRAEGQWVEADFWFGFDVTHSWMMGTENMLIAMYEEPELVMDMFDTYLNQSIKMFDQIWEKGYKFDSIFWYDDMGYKGHTFFSNEMYDELLRPFHKRAIDWAHDHGIYAHLHSCGDIMTRVDQLIDIKLDALNPLEVKAGMEPLTLKEKYGDKLVLHGGINAVLWNDKEAIVNEINRVIPKLKENGGYIFSSDHSIPNTVSLENFKTIVEAVKKVGKY